SREHLKEIVEIQLDYLRKRLAERHITLELTETARDHLASVGYDPTYGARPLKRAIQRELETALGRQLLKGDVQEGQTVVVDYDRAASALTFKVSARSEATPTGDGDGAQRASAA